MFGVWLKDLGPQHELREAQFFFFVPKCAHALPLTIATPPDRNECFVIVPGEGKRDGKGVKCYDGYPGR